MPSSVLPQCLCTHCLPLACLWHTLWGWLLLSFVSVQMPYLREAFLAHPSRHALSHYAISFIAMYCYVKLSLLFTPLMAFSLTRIETPQGQGQCLSCSLCTSGHSRPSANICWINKSFGNPFLGHLKAYSMLSKPSQVLLYSIRQELTLLCVTTTASMKHSSTGRSESWN